MRRLVLCAGAVVLAWSGPACFSPDYGNMSFSCGEGGSCPGGYSCKADNRCYRSGGPDGPERDSAPVDAAIQNDAAAIDAMVSADGAATDGSMSDGGAADATSEADAGPPPDANCSPMSLLVDGDFDETENNNADWIQESGVSAPLIYDDALLPHSSPNHLWLCGYDSDQADAVDSIGQIVSVPAGGGAITVSGVIRQSSNGTGGTGFIDPDDFATLEITDMSGTTVLETLATWTGDNVGSWTPFAPATSSSTYGGQTVRIRLFCDPDDNYVSNFYFDSLEATYDPCP